ncbi:hypothetical protein PS2015_3060 [Pseudohongiella spirulinae]|uniref:Uncharacterized protein n=1 Tax=Pseudohongiella spirulinae TaxID=1249552 RepID=A0A0S2KI19_9GAMM|nr:hypothetical protein PS2015_3060 [Pseudohongiella spirulinae]
MATQYSASAHDTSFEYAVRDNSVLSVVGARGIKAALIADQQA